MLREVIIDGYNLLHAASLARPSYGPGDLERCRKRLLQRLADLIDERHRATITVVFDAKQPPDDLPDRGLFQSMIVRFAIDHAEADDLIEHLIHASSTPRRLLVVSGDQRLRQAARRKGAHSITGEEFLDALEAEAGESTQARTGVQAAEQSLEDVTQELAAIDIDTLLIEMESERLVERLVHPTGTSMPTTASDGTGGLPIDLGTQPRNEAGRITSEDEVTFWNARIAELLREERPAD